MSRQPMLAVLGMLLLPTAHALEYRTVLPKQSAIGFEYQQMGVGIKGTFSRFSAQLRFDPAAPAAASARIEVALASIDAGSPDADAEAAGKLWFNSNTYPTARFVSTQIRALGPNQYEMRGTLTIKGRSRELVIPVRYEPGPTTASFDGSFVLRRLDFGIGEGMWADVSTVANAVRVSFHVVAAAR